MPDRVERKTTTEATLDMKPEQLTDEQRRSKAFSAWAAVGMEIARRQAQEVKPEAKEPEKGTPLESPGMPAPSEGVTAAEFTDGTSTNATP